MQSSTRTRGFASMNEQKQREIARKGGKAAHAKGTAHEFSTDEARAAGRKGGERVSTNREHMSRIGRIGGKRSAAKRQSPDGSDDTMATDRPGEGANDMIVESSANGGDTVDRNREPAGQMSRDEEAEAHARPE